MNVSSLKKKYIIINFTFAICLFKFTDCTTITHFGSIQAFTFHVKPKNLPRKKCYLEERNTVLFQIHVIQFQYNHFFLIVNLGIYNYKRIKASKIGQLSC